MSESNFFPFPYQPIDEGTDVSIRDTSIPIEPTPISPYVSAPASPPALKVDNFNTPAHNSLAVARYARESLVEEDISSGRTTRSGSRIRYGSQGHRKSTFGGIGSAYSWLMMNNKVRKSFTGATGSKQSLDEEEIPLNNSYDEKCEDYVHSWATMYMMFVSKGLANIETYNMPLINVVPRFEAVADATWKPSREVYWELFFVSLPIFMSYGAVVSMQHKLKDQFELNFNGMTKAQVGVFEHGTSMNFVGNLIFRLAHNIVLANFKPRERVLTALFVMFCSIFSLGFWVYVMEVQFIPVVAVCYFLTGCSVGTFEANILSCVTPLGAQSKLWMMIGIPVGFNSVAIGGMFAIEAGMNPAYIWFTICSIIILSVTIFSTTIPDPPTIVALRPGEHVKLNDDHKLSGQLGEVIRMVSSKMYTIKMFETNQTLRVNTADLEVVGRSFLLWTWISEWRDWFPLICLHAGATMIIMCSLNFFTCFNLYAMTTKSGVLNFRWFPGGKMTTMSCNTFFGIMASFQFFADFISRNIIFRLSININPLLCSCVALLGGCLCWMRQPAVTLCGMFCISFGVGSCYSLSIRHIDAFVPLQYNLIAVSSWLLCGDMGSVTGSNTWQPTLSLLGINS